MTAAVADRRVTRRTLPSAPAWWADVAGSAAVLSLLVVTALWTADRGMQELLAGTATGLTSLGRLAGLLSADLMLIQVVLMARVPLIERRFGQDRIARWHRLAGFTSFNLLLAHVGLTILGYAGTARQGVLAETWDLVATYPGMLLATAAFGLLVLVVVTSVRAARRRLRYESWHLLHLYAYLGIALALPHQLWTGADFLASAAALAYWWTVYLLALASVLVFRLGLPAWRSLRHRVEVAAVVPEAPGITSVWLRGRDLHRLPVRAGQFFCWRFLDGPGWSRAHPYSLSAPPSGDLMRITVKDLGDDSARVATLRPGTRVLLEGPYGRLTGEHWRGGAVTMLACGVGITPLLALLWELPYRPGEAVLLYRARTEQELAFRAELDRLAAERGVVVHHLVGPRARRPAWLPAHAEGLPDAEALRRLSPGIHGGGAGGAGRAVAGRPAHDLCLNAGGDVLLRTAPGRPGWRVGVEDPDHPERLLDVLERADGAVATSGTARRGAHIVDPRADRPAEAVRSVTVVGPELLWADVYATAAVARGADALDWLATLDGYAALLVDAAGRIRSTPDWPGTRPTPRT